MGKRVASVVLRRSFLAERADRRRPGLTVVGVSALGAKMSAEREQSTADFVLGDAFARVLTETTQSLICVLDGDGRILLFNDACERATGFTRDEVLGREVWDFVIPHEEA